MQRLFICLKERYTYTTGHPTSTKATITVIKETYPGFPLFERVSHKIQHKNDFTFGTYIIYNGTKHTKRNVLFEYANARHLLDKVEGYYSIQNPDKILLLGFKYQDKFHNGTTYYYTYNNYKTIKTTDFDLISKSNFSLPRKQGPGNDLISHNTITHYLTRENKREDRDVSRKIIVTKEQSTMKYIKEITGEVCDSGFYKLAFIANTDATKDGSASGPYKISIETIFEDARPESDNPFDIESFNSFKIIGQHYDLITVYYSNSDNALLVELVNDESKIHIRRVSLKGKGQWEKESRPFEYTTSGQLVKILEVIQYGSNNNIIILLDRQATYGNNDTQPTFSQEKNGPQLNSILVTEHTLGSTSYKYFEQKISAEITYLKNNSMSDFLTLEVLPHIDNKRIRLKGNRGNSDQQIYYRQCLINRMYVYFYSYPGDKSIDIVPLLLYSNNKWYSPQSKVTYFYEWTEATELKLVADPTSYVGGFNYKIKEELDKTNMMLNEINLTETSTYGIHWGCRTPSDLRAERIKVEHEYIGRYNKYTHLTTNKFQLGSIKHEKKELTGERTSSITIPNNYNLLTVYYDKCDNKYASPLLICICNQDNKYQNVFYERADCMDVTKWIKANGDTSSLKTDDYLTKKIFTILLSIGLSVRLKLEKQVNYDVEIYRCNPEPNAKSKQVSVKLTCHDKGSTYFKCFTHIIPEPDKHQSIKELIPYMGSNKVETYISITSDGSKGVGFSDGHKEPIHFNLCDKNLYVYFYGKDPRPLLFCYNKRTYRPENKEKYEKWINVENLAIHDCPTDWINQRQLIKTLKSICSFMNPVRMDQPYHSNSSSTSYCIHTLDDNRININLNKQTTDWYTKFTHRRNSGYRLGNITHSKASIKSEGDEIISAYEYQSVTAFFLKMDNTLIYPLFICFGKGDKFGPYYELEKITTNIYTYKKFDGEINLKDNDMGQRLTNIIKKLDSETQKMIITVYGDRSQSLAKFAHNLEQQSLNLMKTVIPVGGAYLVACSSVWPLANLVHAFLVLI